jgi:hypothetical protein
LAYIKRLESTYEETLALTISWRVDFIENTSYTIKGDATRSFQVEISLITT